MGRALEASLRRSPDDWDAWRVYGDWLTEHGDVRGQLVAWEHRREAPELSAEEDRALREQILALKAEHRGEWLAGWTPPEGVELGWRGGFITGAWLRWNDDSLDALDALVALPAARLFAALHLEHTDVDGVRALAEWRNLGSLTALDLSCNCIGDAGAQVLAAHASLSGLVTLNLRDAGLGTESAHALAATTSLPSLAVLYLGYNRINAEGARPVVADVVAQELELDEPSERT